MSNWAKNKIAAQFKNTEPTATDQSAANDADINVIVGRFIKTGFATGQSSPPLPAMDFTALPDNFRDMLETARDLDNIRRRLPSQLAEMTPEDILQLTDDQLRQILTPPAPPPAPAPTPTPTPTT